MISDKSNLEMDFTLESERSGVVDEPVFQLLVLGDWSCDAPKRDVASRRPVEIDRDNFDDVLASMGVRLDLEIGGTSCVLEFRDLDDFHPDRLYKALLVFAELQDLRKRLRNAGTFNSAARDVRDRLSFTEERVVPKAESDPEPSETPEGGLLDAILQKPEGGGAATGVSADVARLVSELVRPHLVAVDENEQANMVAAVDAGVSDLMRSILHDRRFQQLEAAWRGLFFLVRRAETSSDLKIFILDLTKDELSADLKQGSPAEPSRYYKVLTTGYNGDPWAAALGDYSFRPNVDDAATLIRASAAGAAARVPFISHVRPEIFGVRSLEGDVDAAEWDMSGASDAGKLWSAVRNAPGAEYLGLTIPRFLARLPYGAATDPIEAFSFEEFLETPGHDSFLWANTCFLAGLCLANTFTQFGWDFGQYLVQDVEGLPLYTFKADGSTVNLPCAEVQLSEKVVEALAVYGTMPVVSFRNMDRVRLARLGSVSDQKPTLCGRWR